MLFRSFVFCSSLWNCIPKYSPSLNWLSLLVWLLTSFLFLLLFFLFLSVCVFLWVFLSVQFSFYHLSRGFVCLFDFFPPPPFLPHAAAFGVLVLWSVVGPETPRWESQVQEIGQPENSWLHGILISESFSRGFHHNTKTQINPMASKLQCWTRHMKQLERQEHNPTN